MNGFVKSKQVMGVGGEFVEIKNRIPEPEINNNHIICQKPNPSTIPQKKVIPKIIKRKREPEENNENYTHNFTRPTHQRPKVKRIKTKRSYPIPTLLDNESSSLVHIDNDPSHLLHYASLKPSLSKYGVKAVQQWRDKFQLNVKNLSRILSYTDNNLEIPRVNLYQGVLKGVVSHLIKTLHTTTNKLISDHLLKDLLKQSFRYIEIPELQPVSVQIMISLPKIPEEYMLHLKSKPELLSTLPEAIRYKVWENYPDVFIELLRPFIRSYLFSLQGQSFAVRFDKPKQTHTERRQTFEGLNEMTNVIHKSVKLYNVLLTYLRSLFMKRYNFSFYMLRFDLYKSFQENGNPMPDPCGWFIEAIDSGMSRGRLSRADCDLLNEIKNCNKREDIQDIIVLCHIDMVKKSLPVLIMRQLEQVIEQKKVPRDFLIFRTLFRLYRCLYLHLKNLKRFNSFPNIDNNITTEFLPLCCILFLPYVKEKLNKKSTVGLRI
eukprot:UN26163